MVGSAISYCVRSDVAMQTCWYMVRTGAFGLPSSIRVPDLLVSMALMSPATGRAAVDISKVTLIIDSMGTVGNAHVCAKYCSWMIADRRGCRASSSMTKLMWIHVSIFETSCHRQILI